jgi:phosphomevalonate kinase
MEGEEIQYPIESHIGHSCNPITEKLRRHVFSEWRVKKINNCPDPFTDFSEDVFHEK